MRPINNNNLNVDTNDIVDKHDYPRSIYKWRNKMENQKRMINPIVGASHGSYPPWDEKISFFHQANEYPQGQMIRIYCDSNS